MSLSIQNILNQYLISLFVFSNYGLCVFNVYPKIKDYGIQKGDDPGIPLILTPMIKAGKIKEAQAACKMTPMKSDISSYAGFLTVDPRYKTMPQLQ
jgi:hypothetical protein